MAGLMVVNGNPAGQYIELSEAETIIGRLQKCTIVLDFQGVSREHARIRREGGNFLLSDLNSRNQTRLNDKPIPPMEDQVLKQGDRINICDVEMVFHLKYPDKKEVIVDLAGPELDSSMMHTLDASRSDVANLSVRPADKLKAILEISRNLCSNLKLEAVAPKILESLINIFPQAEQCFMALIRTDDPRQTLRQTFHKARPAKKPPFKGRLTIPEDEPRVRISRTIVNYVLTQKEAVLSQDAGADADLPTSASIADLNIKSVMCAPLLTPDSQVLGILQIDTSDRKQFTNDDLELLVAVANQAAIAIQNAEMYDKILNDERLSRDLRLATEVQKRFLPHIVPSYAGYEFFAHYHSAYEVGGDYYDFVRLPNNRLAIALGDVAGKGVSAALMMAKFSGDTRYCLITEDSPAAAASTLNTLLLLTGVEEKFITMSLGLLDIPKRQLTFCSAGHLPLLLRRVDGTVEELGEDIGNFPLGIMPDIQYEQKTIELAPGEVMVVYSDGVTDARSPAGELYHTKETPRLNQRLAQARGGPEAIGKAIIQDIREFSLGQAQADDITLICYGLIGP